MGDRNAVLVVHSPVDLSSAINGQKIESTDTEENIRSENGSRKFRTRTDIDNCVRSQFDEKGNPSYLDDVGIKNLKDMAKYTEPIRDSDNRLIVQLQLENKSLTGQMRELEDQAECRKLKLQLVDEKLRTHEKEINLRDDEVQRITGRARQMQSDLQDVTLQLEISENKCSSTMKLLQQQEKEFYAAQQEVKTLRKSEEQLNSTLVRLKNTHSMEISRLNHEADDLRDQIDQTERESTAAKDVIATLTGQLDAVTRALELEKKSCQEAIDEINQRGLEIEHQDRDLKDLKTQIQISQQELNLSSNRIVNLESEVDIYRKKSESAVADILKLESSFAKASDHLSSMQKQISDKDALIMQMKHELEDAQTKVNTAENDLFVTKTTTIRKLEDELAERLNDLKAALEHLSRNNSTILNLNEQLVLLRNDNFQKDDALQRTKLEFISYRERHTHDNKEFFEKDSIIQQMELEVRETNDELRLQLHKISDLSEDVKEMAKQLTYGEKLRKELFEQKNELEKANRELIADNATLQQKFASEKLRLKHQISQLATDLDEAKHHIDTLEKESTDRDDKLSYLAADLKATKMENTAKNEDIENLQRLKTEESNKLSEAYGKLRMAENHIAELEGAHTLWKEEMERVVTQYKSALQSCSWLEEKLTHSEQSRTSVQEKLASKETEFAKLESSHRKLLTELMSLKELNSSHEDEIQSQEDRIKALHEELLVEKDAAHGAVQEMVLYKQKLSSLEYAFEAQKESQKQLNDKLLHQGHLLNQLQQDFDSKSNQAQELIRQLQLSKQTIGELQDEIDLYQKRERTNSNKFHDQEAVLDHVTAEKENLQQRMRDLVEQLACRDGELQIARSNLETSQKQCHHQQQEIAQYEEAIARLKVDLEKSQSLYSTTSNKLMECQHQVHELTVQLSTLKGNHQEMSNELTDKSRQVIMMNAELNHAKQQCEAMRTEISLYEEKISHLKLELTKLREGNEYNENERRRSDKMCQELRNEITVLTSRNQHNMREMSIKDEEQILLRIELSSLQEMLKKQDDDSKKLKSEIDSLRCKLNSTTEEKFILNKDLEESRIKNSLLCHEEERIAQNVNQILEKQKISNNVLDQKVREQSEAIVQLMLEKDQLQNQVLQMQKERNRLEMEIDRRSIDYDAFKALQNHSGQQLMVIHHLRKKLDEQFEELEQKSKSKLINI